jgi:hypothetical protein
MFVQQFQQPIPIINVVTMKYIDGLTDSCCSSSYTTRRVHQRTCNIIILLNLVGRLIIEFPQYVVTP